MKQDSAHSGLEATVSLIYCVLHFRYFILRCLQSFHRLLLGSNLVEFYFKCPIGGPQVSHHFLLLCLSATGMQREHMEKLIDSCQVKKIRAIHQVWTSWTLSEADPEELGLTVHGKSERTRTQSPADELEISWLNSCKTECILCTGGFLPGKDRPDIIKMLINWLQVASILCYKTEMKKNIKYFSKF